MEINSTNVYFLNSNDLTIYECIPESTKFDVIVCDPPMGVLDRNIQGSSWDNALAYDIFLPRLFKTLKQSGVFILFSHVNLVSTWLEWIRKNVNGGEVQVLYWVKSNNFRLTRKTYCKFFLNFSSVIFFFHR